MIPARPKSPAAMPPTTAPVEIVAPVPVESPLLVGEGLDVREVGLSWVNEVETGNGV